MPAELGNPHDRFFKELWSRIAVGQDFLRAYLPTDVVAVLDLDTLELTKESFVDEQLRAHYSDLLYRVKRQDGGAGFVYLLLEHKRTPERLTAFQLLRYLVRIWERVLEQTPDKISLPPIIPVVVYHGDTPWPHGQTLQAALTLPEALAPHAPDFRYVLCDLTGLAETEISGAVLLRVALLLMKHISAPRLAERLPEVFGLLRELGDRRTVLRALETLLRYLAAAAETVSEEDLRRALAAALPEPEETLMATLAQQWLEQGQAQGRKEGRQEGRQEGRKEGRAEGEYRLLTKQLENRFRALPKPINERLKAARAEQLEQWAVRLLTAQSLDDLFSEDQ